MKQLRQVVMLPTKKASSIIKDFNNKLIFNYNDTQSLRDGYQFQHLYITSDEEIKEGDGALHQLDSKVIQIVEGLLDGDIRRFGYTKVIATTNKSIGISKDEFESKNWLLPQIPESFIKAFVESNGTIEEVLVEYEEIEGAMLNLNYKLKTRPDNTIIISQAKTYTRDEVEILCNSAYANGMVAQQFIEDLPTPRVRFKQWIKDNL